MFTWLSQTQLSWMWTALTQWWSGLLQIWIQLLPYAIALTVVLIIFWLIKNWSRLKVWRSDDYVVAKDKNEYRDFKKHYDKHWNLKKKYDMNYNEHY